MAVTEQQRHQILTVFEEQMGQDLGASMMELLSLGRSFSSSSPSPTSSGPRSTSQQRSQRCDTTSRPTSPPCGANLSADIIGTKPR